MQASPCGKIDVVPMLVACQSLNFPGGLSIFFEQSFGFKSWTIEHCGTWNSGLLDWKFAQATMHFWITLLFSAWLKQMFSWLLVNLIFCSPAFVTVCGAQIKIPTEHRKLVQSSKCSFCILWAFGNCMMDSTQISVLWHVFFVCLQERKFWAEICLLLVNFVRKHFGHGNFWMADWSMLKQCFVQFDFPNWKRMWQMWGFQFSLGVIVIAWFQFRIRKWIEVRNHTMPTRQKMHFSFSCVTGHSFSQHKHTCKGAQSQNLKCCTNGNLYSRY